MFNFTRKNRNRHKISPRKTTRRNSGGGGLVGKFTNVSPLSLVTDKIPDKNLLGTIILLHVFGLIMVYSASFLAHSNTFFFFLRQLIFLIAGGAVSFLAFKIDYKILERFVLPLLFVSIILLVAVLIPGIGKEIQGARRWIDLGFFDLQPSEVIKLTFLVYIAAWSSRSINQASKTFMHHVNTYLLPFISILGLVCGLVLLQPDLATTGLIGLISLSVYYLGGNDIWHKLGTLSVLAMLVILGIGAAVLAPYRLARVQTYVEFLQSGEVSDPYGSGYQLQNVLVAVGSGGMWGVGFGESKQKFHYLGQTAATDNIFAVIAEEFGFVGSSALILAYFYFCYKGITLSHKNSDKFGLLLGSGITIWLTLQAFIHIGTNIGLVPLTGVPLPFISYGGSSVITNLVACGILLQVTAKDKSARR